MNLSKKIFALFFMALVSSFFVYSQENHNTENVSEQTIPLMDQSESSISLSLDAQPASGTTSRSSGIFTFFRMIFALAFVIACIYGILWFLRRSGRTNPDNDDPFLRKVASVDVAAGKSVQIVTLYNKAYVLGVSENQINLLGTLSDKDEDEKELISAMNLYADKHDNVKKPRSFADILDIFMPGGPREKGNLYSDVQENSSQILKNLRDKLNK